MAVVTVDGLNLKFGAGPGAAQVLNQVSFAAAQGEVFGLVGESGSGKSTILRCIAGLYTHWTGAIHLDGKPAGQKLDKARARLVQMVFQDPYGSLHPRRTVHTTLAEPLAIHDLGDPHERIDKVLREVGLGPQFRYRYPHQLSGGQRQRVAIARALILEPRILLLDEPTSALDVSVQAEILNLFADIQARAGLTYILVSHDLGVIAHMCHRFAVMQHGRILETLTREELAQGRARDPYTQVLIEASRHYDRSLARKIAQSEKPDTHQMEDSREDR
jgi:peptide/nickel transport system ATP-binding protein